MINWIVRYSEILARFPELFDQDRTSLEVGCGSQGIAQYVNRRIVGLDFVFSSALGRCRIRFVTAFPRQML